VQKLLMPQIGTEHSASHSSQITFTLHTLDSGKKVTLCGWLTFLAELIWNLLIIDCIISGYSSHNNKI